VCAVALGRAAGVAAAITRIAGIERAWAGRGPQHALDGVDHGASALAFHYRMRNTTDREQLVGPAGSIDRAAHVVGIDHIVELAALGVPEPSERIARAVGLIAPAGDRERVDPQRLDLDRLADPRGDALAGDPRIH